jgi:hypothetical protein
MFDRMFARLRAFHDEYARVVLAIIAALLVPLCVMTTVATLDNWRQDNERDDLLSCFDDVLAASSASSTAVREASVDKDIATAARDDALNAEGIAFQRLVQHILVKTVTAKDVKALSETLDARSHAAHQLDVAQDALDKAREDNPVPPAPSVFCARN